MTNWIADRAIKYREFLGLDADAALIPAEKAESNISPELTAALERFNIEWHFIPAADALPFDDNYLRRFYPSAKELLSKTQKNDASVRDKLLSGHRRQQGYIVGVETTQKPVYLPRNRQFYGTHYGHDAAADPLGSYFGLAGITTGTRFDQTYPILRRLFDILNEDWRKRNLLPEGYRVTICPPGIFNLIGTIFHPEWSATDALELGFYRDERGNATCFAVGANAPNDFSYIDIIEGEEWSLTGFRLALLPDETRFDAK